MLFISYECVVGRWAAIVSWLRPFFFFGLTIPNQRLSLGQPSPPYIIYFLRLCHNVIIRQKTTKYAKN